MTRPVAGRRVEMFNKVYEWTCVDGEWSLELVTTSESLALMEELQRLLSGTGEVGDGESVHEAVLACQERLRELGVIRW